MNKLYLCNAADERDCIVYIDSCHVTFEITVSFDGGHTGYQYSFRKEDIRNILGFVRSLVQSLARIEFGLSLPYHYCYYNDLKL